MEQGYLRDYGTRVGNSRIDGSPLYKLYDKIYKIDSYGDVVPVSSYDSRYFTDGGKDIEYAASTTVMLSKKPYTESDILLLI